MKFKLTATGLITISCFFASPINAQVGGMSQMRADRHMRYLHEHFDEFGEGKRARLMRYYTGVAKPFINVDINQHYIAPASSLIPTPSQAPTDVTIETKTSGHKALGVYAGTFFPFIPTGASSAIGLDLSVSGGIFSTSIGPINYGKNVMNFYENGSAMYFNIPLAICIKSGGEVSMSKQDRELLSFGVGLAPSLVTAQIITTSMRVNMKKFVMAEIGAFTGLAWKIRAAYYPGSYSVVKASGVLMAGLNNYTGPGDGSLDVDAKTSNEFSVSFVLLPFSYKWSK